MTRAWLAESLRGGVLLVIAVLAGVVAGDLAAALAAALVAYLAWHLFNLYRLERWLRDGRRFSPPRGAGIWGEIFHHYYRLQKRNRARKQRLAALVREFRASTAAIPDGAVVLGPRWEILWFNAAAERLLGLQSAEDAGQRIGNLIRDPTFIEYLVRGDYRLPVATPSPRDPERRLSFHLVPYGGSQHLLLVRDVTRLYRLERMRREFVANASHELRSPLTVVAGYLDTLLDDTAVADDELGPVLASMQAQTTRMQSIVTDLLELARLENEEGHAPSEPVDMPALLNRVRADAVPLCKPGQRLSLELVARAPLLGVADELRSAVANLVSNALAYTPEGGAVTIRYEASGDGATVSVSDDGPGIAAEHLPRLTERFYRVDRGRARRDGGTGLGLSIVKHVLQRHDAALEIDSEVGRGSTFTARFPAARVGVIEG